MSGQCVWQWWPTATNIDAYRGRGRPATRWDNRLNEFARAVLHIEEWQDACRLPDFPAYEDAYVEFHTDEM